MTDNAANMKHALELMLADDVVESVDSKDDDELDGVLGEWKPNIEGWHGCSAHQLQLVVNDGYMELRGYHRIQLFLVKLKQYQVYYGNPVILLIRCHRKSPYPVKRVGILIFVFTST